MILNVLYCGKDRYGSLNGFKITKESDKFYGIYYYDVLITSSVTKNGAFKKFKLMMKMYEIGYEYGKELWR